MQDYDAPIDTHTRFLIVFSDALHQKIIVSILLTFPIVNLKRRRIKGVTLYDIIGAEPASTTAQIRQSYCAHKINRRKIAVVFCLYADIDYAYSVLADETTRVHYDEFPDEFLELAPTPIVI